MNRMQCSAEQFQKDVAKHELTIIRDEGLYRHLRFAKNTASWDQAFQIITFPGSLVYTGDMGTYVFSRIPDMFQFFRGHKERPLQINPSYWAEKCDAASRFGNGIKEWCADAFREFVRHKLDDSEAPDEIRELADETVLAHADDGQIMATAALWQFQDDISDRSRAFECLEGFDPTRYTFHYLWCCYALVWAIDRYDQALEERAGKFASHAASGT
jgi:hypothetical protein